MKQEAQKFEKEINKIFEDNNINVKYITLKDKKCHRIKITSYTKRRISSAVFLISNRKS